MSSAVSAGVTQGLSDTNLGKNFAKVAGFNSGQIGDMSKFNSFVGSLAGTAVTYGMTGNAKFNLARISNLGENGAYSVGLWEMNLGDEGFSMNLGMGGTDISMGTIASSYRGLQHWGMNNQIEAAALRNGMNVGTVLRSQYGFGDVAAKDQLASILDGSTTLAKATGTQRAETITADGKRTVYLSGYKDDMSLADQLSMGITLQHEAYRDGIVDENNLMETGSAVLGHTEMALRMAGDGMYAQAVSELIENDENLYADVANYIAAGGDKSRFGSYVDQNYDSSADYWKLTKDGKLINDGSSKLTIEYQDGHTKVLGDDETSMAAALVHYLGEDRTNQLLKESGQASMPDQVDTLVDVLKISKTEAEYLLKNPNAYLAKQETLTQYQKDQIKGENLLKGTSKNQFLGRSFALIFKKYQYISRMDNYRVNTGI
jgi:hypothetical protein